MRRRRHGALLASGGVTVAAKAKPILCPAGEEWPTGVPFPSPIVDNEVRFKFETRGPWGILTRLEGVAVEKVPEGLLVHGVHSLLRPRESGYCHEGSVHVGGRRRRAFTSSALLRVEGKLVSVGVLHVCAERR